jgi:flagellar motility protein MotE (MotC chaperone)
MKLRDQLPVSETLKLPRNRRAAWVLIALASAIGSAMIALSPDSASSAEDSAKAESSPKAEATAKVEGAAAGHESASAGASNGASPHSASGSTSTAASSQKAPPARRSDSSCLVDPSAVEDLRRRGDEIELKAKELQSKEQEMVAQKRAIEEEVKRLSVLRDEIEKLQGAVKKANEEKVQKVVETLESMPPKGAAQMMAALDESLAVSAMPRLSTQKLAKILNLMSPDRSARLAEKLAGIVKSRSTSSEKGGTAYDGSNEIESVREPANSAVSEPKAGSASVSR